MKNPNLTSDLWWRTESFSSYDQEDNKIPTFASSLLEVLVRVVKTRKRNRRHPIRFTLPWKLKSTLSNLTYSTWRVASFEDGYVHKRPESWYTDAENVTSNQVTPDENKEKFPWVLTVFQFVTVVPKVKLHFLVLCSMKYSFTSQCIYFSCLSWLECASATWNTKGFKYFELN